MARAPGAGVCVGELAGSGRTEVGMTLVEVIVALAILLVVLVPATLLVGHEITILGTQRAKVVASNLATSELSQITSQAESGAIPSGYSSGTLTKPVGGVTYRVVGQVVGGPTDYDASYVTDSDHDVCTTSACSPKAADTDHDGLNNSVQVCQVIASVTWAGGGPSRTVVMSSALSPSGGQC